MINIYRKNDEKRTLTYINAVPSHHALEVWMTKNIVWTHDASEIDQQLKKGNKITRHELRAIAEHKDFVFVEFGLTPEHTDEEEMELDD